MKSRVFIWVGRASYSSVIIGLSAAIVLSLRPDGRSQVRGQRPTTVPVKPDVAIATNVVLATVLASVSDTVRRLEIPLETPLDPSRVKRFETRTVLPARVSCLQSVLEYEGGYEFRHQNGIVYALSMPDSYRGPVGPSAQRQARYRPETCLATFKVDMLKLGHRNLTVLDDGFWAHGPMDLDRSASRPRRWILTWPDRKGKGQQGAVARAEIDADTLAIKSYWLAPVHFGKGPSPSTLEPTNLVVKPRKDIRLEPEWSELQVQDVNRSNAVELVRAMVSEASEFCRKVGPPFPPQVTQDDIVLQASKVQMVGGQPLVFLRLKSGFGVTYYKGRVGKVETADTCYNAPETDALFRESEEFRGPVRVSPQEAVSQVLEIALRRLSLPEKALWLDTPPFFQRTVTAGQTHGVRRYILCWRRPESDQERERRERFGWPRETSVWGEVDAVSGALKLFALGDKTP